jgi:hypothetical protein
VRALVDALERDPVAALAAPRIERVITRSALPMRR